MAVHKAVLTKRMSLLGDSGNDGDTDTTAHIKSQVKLIPDMEA